MSRFRPNIVIDDTSEPFDEDNWKAIQIGNGAESVILHIAKVSPHRFPTNIAVVAAFSK